MTIQICSCEGLNPNCAKCFGSGYINSATSRKSVPTVQKEKKPNKKAAFERETFLPEKIEAMSGKELETISFKLIASLDLKSKKQMQLLNSIPFNTNTFRRDLKDKFETLKNLENEKKNLRNELALIKEEMTRKKYTGKFQFRHFLSQKDIDVDSNRQLKELIKEHKKNKTGS